MITKKVDNNKNTNKNLVGNPLKKVKEGSEQKSDVIVKEKRNYGGKPSNIRQK